MNSPIQLLLCLCVILKTADAFPSQERISFNDDWEFRRDFDGAIEHSFFQKEEYSAWETVQLPHTAKIEPLVIEKQWQGTCLYRKFFTLPPDAKDRYVALHFGAAMHEAKVYLDGELVGEHVGGYLPFVIELTGRVVPGRQHCVLVWLNNADNPAIPPGKPIAELDFQYYSGLYRGVALVIQDKLRITDPVAAGRIAGGGLKVHCEAVSPAMATVCVQAEVANGYTNDRSAAVRVMLLNAKGKEVANWRSDVVTIQNGEQRTFCTKLALARPELWSPETPNLYHLRAEVVSHGRVSDKLEILIGVRTVSLSTNGFFLNGEKAWLRGANRHQEYPYVGNALSDQAQWRDAWKIKSAGFNFVRCSHYPPAPAFLDACDALGLFVLDAIPGWQFFGDRVFQDHAIQDVRDMIRRDRNHPSIMLWEASLNETDMSPEFMARAVRAVHEELPSEQTYTSGFIDGPYDVFAPARAHDRTQQFWKNYVGQRPLLIAEYGDWEYYADNAGFQQPEFNGLKPEERSSRQLRAFGEKRLAQQALNFQEAHNDNHRTPAIGAAIWVMFDYNRGYAPDVESSGIMDVFRIPKPVFYFYQSQAGPVRNWQGFGAPMVHIANYWTTNSSRHVVVYSNCEEVELFLNDKAIVRQKPDQDRNCDHLAHPPTTFSIDQFVPGTLKAIGYLQGKAAAQATVRTPEAPVALRISVDTSNQSLRAGANDLVFVHAEVADKHGTIVPDATQLIRFVVKGDGEIIGDNPISAEAGIATVLLRAGKGAGALRLIASAENLRSATFRLNSRKNTP